MSTKALEDFEAVAPTAERDVNTLRDEVRERLLKRVNKDGTETIKPVVANLVTILQHDPAWPGVLGYDELAEKIVKLKSPPWHPDDAPKGDCLGFWAEEDATRTAAFFDRAYGLSVSSNAALEAVATAARSNAFNPVVDYLNPLKWDGKPRCGDWLVRYFGAPNTEYVRRLGAMWLLSAVARAYEPGCKADYVLVLEGEQGLKKSSGLRALCPRVEWFFDGDVEFGDKDAAQVIRGAWIIELAELESIVSSRANLHAAKAFISRQVDIFRPSYGRTVQRFPRRCVSTGSTNDHEYLRDMTGNRRFWPVRITKVDLEGIASDRDQIWAETRDKYRAGERWFDDSIEFTKAATEEQEDRLVSDPWEAAVAEWLARPAAKLGVLTSVLLWEALGIRPAGQTKADEARVTAILRSLGWERGGQSRVNGVRVRRFRPKVSPPPPAGDGTGDRAGDTQSNENLRTESNTSPVSPPNTYTYARERLDLPKGLIENTGDTGDTGDTPDADYDPTDWLAPLGEAE